MTFVQVQLRIDSLENETIAKINGTIVRYKKKQYIVTPHQGLPIKGISVCIDEDVIECTEYTICQWNDLIIIPFENKIPSFVFKQFVKKQINVSTSYFIDNMVAKYISNDFHPINMIPGNPLNMYYMMKITHQLNENDCGKPVYNNNKLIGILVKNMDNIIYVCPTIYLLNSITKQDNNHIYTIECDLDKIKQINRYKVTDNKTIYYRRMDCLMPVKTFIALEGDINTAFEININHIIRPYQCVLDTNRLIQNSIKININGLNIGINSCFIHMMKLCYNDIDLIKRIFKNIHSKEKINFTFNEKQYILSF